MFRESLEAPFSRILNGIDAALDLEVDFINLSLGTTRFEVESEASRMNELITRAIAQRARIISPASSERLPCYPALLDGVDGVLMDARLEDAEPEFRELEGHAFWYALPYPRDLPNLPRDYNLSGVSMAVARVTGHLASTHRREAK